MPKARPIFFFTQTDELGTAEGVEVLLVAAASGYLQDLM
jgi:hypothetical protein